MGKEMRKYHFESSHVPYSVCELEILFENNTFIFTSEETLTQINLSSNSLRRENDEMTMFFDFESKSAFVELKENQARLAFDILESDMKFENNILHLDFKYILDEEEMFISLSIA